MTAERTYTAIYERHDGDAWTVAIQGLNGCQTYGRSLSQAHERIRQALAVWLDCNEDSLDIHDRYPAKVTAVATRVARARDQAQRAGSKAHQQTIEAVKTLTALGLSRRDAGELLGLSHQRIQQLLEAS